MADDGRGTTSTASTAVRWLSDDEQRAWRAFLEMQAVLNAQINRDLQDSSGLSSADFAVLVHLSEHEGGSMRVLELARGVQWEKSRLSHQLSRMQQRGLIERAQCDADRRGAHVVLTEAGRRAVETAAPLHVASVRRYLFDSLDPAQVEVLHAIARGTVERIAAHGAGSGCGAAEAAEDDSDATCG